MHLEIKKTFFEIVDDDDLQYAAHRRSSAPASFAVAEQISRLKTALSMSPNTPLKTWSDQSNDDEPTVTPKTTVIIRNIPPSYTRSMLLELIDAEGFACLYDFVYLPIKIKWNKAFGYAFINLCNENEGSRFLEHFTNFSRWGVPHDKCAEVDWSKDNQGLEAQVQRYRDSPMMHVSSPDEMKPITLKAGTRVPFPEPTKLLAESKSNSDSSEKHRSQTWGHFGHHIDASCAPQEPSWLSNSEASEHVRAQKKAERSVKRIKGKLAKTGYNPNM